MSTNKTRYNLIATVLFVFPFMSSCSSVKYGKLNPLDPSIERVNYKIGENVLSVIQGGPLNGKKVVFIHGIPANSLLWENVLKRFIQKGYRVYAPDLPGYGQTRINRIDIQKPSPFSLEGAADVLNNWISQEDLGKVWMVSHDIGGGVGQIFAAKYENSLTHATFSNCIVSDKWPVFAIRLLKILSHMRMYETFAKWGGMEHGISWSKLKTSVYDKSKISREVAYNVMWYDKVYSEKGRADFARHLRELSPSQLASFDKKLTKISVPVLLAWAKNDPNQPWEESGQYLKRLIGRPDVLFLDEAGHFFQLEKPDEYVNLLTDWYEKQTQI